MPFFGRKPKCPYCGEKLSKEPSRKTDCPHCSSSIHVRSGKLVTVEEAEISDWLFPLNIGRKLFDKARKS